MIKFIAITSDRITDTCQNLNQAVLLWKNEETLEESSQCVLRINDENSEIFKDFKKYTKEEIAVARKDKHLLVEEIPKGVISRSSPFSEKKLETGQKIFKRIHGSSYVDISAGDSEVLKITNSYAWSKMQAIEIIGAGTKHSMDLKVLDDSDVVINQFSFSTNISKDFYRVYSKYDSDLYLGMSIEVTVYNNSSTTSSVGLNIELNEIKT